MEIKAVKLYENGFMTGHFATSGGEGANTPDNGVRYPSSLQNYLIDTGKEVILVDTGVPKETKNAEPNEKTRIYMGTRINDYVSALEAMGYSAGQVTKILVTHKHPDHSGELRSFPGARIYIAPEDAEALKLSGENVVLLKYADGPYHNFDSSERIAEGIYMLPAKGHTKGNSIVVAESGGLFYMMQGDVTYTDAALRENKLSVIFEDLQAARETLEKVRTFVRENPTVYLSTHTPEACTSLENKTVMKLD